MTLTAVFFDAGNTLVSLDYAAIVDVLEVEGFRVTRDEVWRAECRARVKLDPFLAQAEVRESRDVFSRYMRYACEEMGISWGERAERVLGRLSEINRREGLWRGGAMPGAREVLAGLKGKGYVVELRWPTRDPGQGRGPGRATRCDHRFAGRRRRKA